MQDGTVMSCCRKMKVMMKDCKGMELGISDDVVYVCGKKSGIHLENETDRRYGS